MPEHSLYCGIHLESDLTRVVLVQIENGKQSEFWEIGPFVFNDPAHIEDFYQKICELMNIVYKRSGSKAISGNSKFNSTCLTFSDFDRRYPEEIREFLTTFMRAKMTDKRKNNYTEKFESMHLAEACLRTYCVPSDKSRFDAAIFLGFDSGCRVIFASDDKNEGVKVAGNTHTELVGSWWWIGKHAINKMLDERDNARQNVSQKKTFSRTETIEKVFRKRFEVSSVYEAVNFLHDSYKYDVTKFAEQLAREHSEDPLVRDVFYDAGVECAKVISKAITSIPYKNRYYREALVTSHSQKGERRPLRVLMSNSYNTLLDVIMEGIRHEFTHNPTISVLEIYWKVEEPPMDAAAMAAILDGSTVNRYEVEPLTILTTGENLKDWSDIYRLPAASNNQTQNDTSSTRSSVDCAGGVPTGRAANIQTK